MIQKINSNFRYATYRRLLLNIPARTLEKHNRRLDDFLQDVDPFNIVEYRDEFYSDDRENCPGLNQLLCDAKHGRFNAVALPCTQMFGASFSHFKSLCEILEENNVVVIATSRLSTLKRLPLSWSTSWPLTQPESSGIHEQLQGLVYIFGEFQTLRAARIPCY